MESRVRGLFLTYFVAIIAGSVMNASVTDIVYAQDDIAVDKAPVIEPELERRELKPAKIDTEDWEIGMFYGLMSVEDFGVNPVWGARLAYHVTERIFFEGAYGQTTTDETSYERLSGAAQLLTDDERDYTYYNLSLGYNLLPSEAFMTDKLAFYSDLYVIGGVGNTDFAGDNHFTINVGAGYRLVTTDWLAIHADVRDHMFDIDILGEDKTTHNIEIHGGITLFF